MQSSPHQLGTNFCSYEYGPIAVTCPQFRSFGPSSVQTYRSCTWSVVKFSICLSHVNLIGFGFSLPLERYDQRELRGCPSTLATICQLYFYFLFALYPFLMASEQRDEAYEILRQSVATQHWPGAIQFFIRRPPYTSWTSVHGKARFPQVGRSRH